MEQARSDEELHDGRDSADVVQVGHEVLPAGGEVGDERNLVADALEVGEGERDTGCASHGEVMQDAICRASQGHHHDLVGVSVYS